MIANGVDRFRSRHAASPEFGVSSGGDVNDNSQQLTDIQKTVIELRSKLDATLPHLATKAELESVRVEVESVRVEVESVRVEVASVRVEMHSLRGDMVKWVVGTLIAGIAAASAVTGVLIRFLGR